MKLKQNIRKPFQEVDMIFNYTIILRPRLSVERETGEEKSLGSTPHTLPTSRLMWGKNSSIWLTNASPNLILSTKSSTGRL